MKKPWRGKTDPKALPDPYSSAGHRINTTMLDDEHGNPWRVGYRVQLRARLDREPDRVVVLTMSPEELDILHTELTELRAQNFHREEY